MLLGRLRVVGLLIVLTGWAAGCTAAAGSDSGMQPADIAVPSYSAAPDTPAYCDLLADSTHLSGIPAAIGVLTGQRGNVEAELDLTAAVDELRAVLAEVEGDGGSPRLEAAIGDLVEALGTARDESLTTSVRDDVSAGLDEVGRLVQPVCDFPS